MLALAIILSVLILIALLRFGLIVEYSDIGFKLWVTAGFFKFSLLGEDTLKKPKKKKLKKKKSKKKEKKSISIKPGSLSVFIDMLKAVINALSRLKHRLLIKQLVLYYKSASNNPSKTAIQYGAANAVFSAIIPVLERNFRIKHRDLRTSFDFTTDEHAIYSKISISIAIWEVFYILFALFPIITTLFKSRSGTKKEKLNKNDSNVRIDRKVGSKNGNSPDKRIDGDNDAKSKGDD